MARKVEINNAALTMARKAENDYIGNANGNFEGNINFHPKVAFRNYVCLSCKNVIHLTKTNYLTAMSYLG